MIYFSFFYLNRINKSQLEQESILRQRAEIELNTYKNKINPEFLYDSLETLIGLSKKDIDKADQFILKLSDIYRNILSTKKTELNAIINEIEVLNNLVQIVDHKFQGNLLLKICDDVKKSLRYIVTGTFIIIIEDIINRSIVSNIQNLKVTIEIKDGYLKISHPTQNKLVQIFSKKTELKQLEQANLQYSERRLFIDEIDNIKTYNIPVFEMEN
jgi:LytS/YehU family sensor histidine kinase